MADDSSKRSLFGLARRALTRAAEKLAEAAGIPLEPIRDDQDISAHIEEAAKRARAEEERRAQERRRRPPSEPPAAVIVQPRPDAETLPPPVPVARLATEVGAAPAPVPAAAPKEVRERPYRTGEEPRAGRDSMPPPPPAAAVPAPAPRKKTEPMPSPEPRGEQRRRRPAPTKVWEGQPAKKEQRPVAAGSAPAPAAVAARAPAAGAAPAPAAPPDPENDEVTLVVRDRNLVVSYAVTPVGVARAGRRAGIEASTKPPLTLRMHTVLLRDDGRIDERTRDVTLPPGEPTGRQTLGVPPAGTHVTCAVGYVGAASARAFAPIAHSSRLQVLP